MANVQIPNLPVAIALNGTEQLEAVQSGTSKRITTAQIVSLAVGQGGNLPFPVSIGGTGQSSFTANAIMIGNGTGALQVIPPPTGSNYVLVGSPGSAPSWQATIPVSAGVDSINFGTTGLTPNTDTAGVITVGGILNASNGGTGLSSYAVGDLLYASGATTISKLSDVATGSVLISGGVNTAPSYSSTPTISTITATASKTASSTTGAFIYGTNSFSDVNVLLSLQSSVNNYNQATIQNTSNGAAASSEFIAYNDQGTAATNYATVGINSSGYTGTGSINSAGYGYFLTGSTDLVIGTVGANAMHFVTNSSATDAMVISSAGVTTIANAVISAGSVTLTSATVPTISGGTGTSSSLTLQSTSGAGTTDSIIFKTASQATRFTINTSGAFGIGSSPAYGTSGQAFISGGNAAQPSWGTLGVSGGGTGATTASGANANLQTYQTTATATQTLTNTSPYYEYYTGTTTTVTLPDVTTLSLGWSFHMANNGSGNVTVNSSGGNLVATILPQMTAHVSCILTTGTTAASWDFGYTDFGSYTGSGAVVLGTAPSFTTSITSPVVYGGTGAASSLTLRSTSGTGTTDSILFQTGNNGAITALTIASNGNATFLSTSTTAIGTLSLTNALTVGNGGTGATTLTLNGVLYGNGTSTVQATTQGAANSILVANAGAPSFTASPTIGTSVTVPLVIGGTAAGSTLTLQSTSGTGTTDQVLVKVGTNGATTAATFASTAAFLLLGAGTTAIAPLKFTSGTNLTTAAAGAVEYDGSVAYFSPAASTRSTIAAEQVLYQGATYTLTSATGVQKLFNASTNGAVTLPVGTYQFECYASFTTLAATGTFGFALAGAATYTQAWQALGIRAAAGAAGAAPSFSFNTTANVAVTPTSATTTAVMWIRGTINVTVTGTVIPQFSQTVASAAVVGVGSYFKISPISGTNGANNVTVGNWS